jgi:hypothetical protein
MLILLVCLLLTVPPKATLISAQGEIPWDGDLILFDLHISFETDHPLRSIELSLPPGAILGYMSFEDKPVSWKQEGDKLNISLPKEVPAGERFGLMMKYALKLPADGSVTIARWTPDFGYPVPVTLSLKLPPWYRLEGVPRASKAEFGGVKTYTWKSHRVAGFSIVKGNPPKPIPVTKLIEGELRQGLFKLIYRSEPKVWYAGIGRRCFTSSDGLRWRANDLVAEEEGRVLDMTSLEDRLICLIWKEGSYFVRRYSIDPQDPLKLGPAEEVEVGATMSQKPSEVESAEYWFLPRRLISIRGKPKEAVGVQVCGLDDGRSFYLTVHSDHLGGILYEPDGGFEEEYKIAQVAHGSRGTTAHMVFDPGSRRLHLVYVDAGGDVRHRVLYHPYRPNNWVPKIDAGMKGELIVGGVEDFALGIDRSENPASLTLIYVKDGGVWRRDYDGVSWLDDEIRIRGASEKIEMVTINEDISEGASLLYVTPFSSEKQVMFLYLWR